MVQPVAFIAKTAAPAAIRLSNDGQWAALVRLLQCTCGIGRVKAPALPGATALLSAPAAFGGPVE